MELRDAGGSRSATTWAGGDAPTRAGMLEVLASDYIRTARAKGLRPMTVLFKHALRNAVIPGRRARRRPVRLRLGGSIVIETIFQINASAISRGIHPAQGSADDAGDRV